MKQVLILSLFFWCGSLSAQVFHFEDTNTTLIKNTNQSPAHWYIEIYNDVAVDTSLRWIASFENIPPEWGISFDAQTQNWSMVEGGDSSDFPLEITSDFPQKLIIGAMLNNTPGHGVVYFDIFDPDFPSYRQTIWYEFIVSSVGLDELNSIPFLSYEDNLLIITNSQETELEVITEDGKLVRKEASSASFDLKDLPQNQALFLLLKQGEQQVVLKLISQRFD